MMDQVSASLTCLGKKRVLALSIPKREAHSRPKEIGLFSAMLGRISILTWSQLMIKTPIAIAAGTAVGLSSAQPALGQPNRIPTSIR
jgi:hypothetical protein